MTTVAAKPAGEERHRLTALEGVAAFSLHAALPVAYGAKSLLIKDAGPG
jgi:hypothetical protein